jgi:hypothetical protein
MCYHCKNIGIEKFKGTRADVIKHGGGYIVTVRSTMQLDEKIKKIIMLRYYRESAFIVCAVIFDKQIPYENYSEDHQMCLVKNRTKNMLSVYSVTLNTRCCYSGGLINGHMSDKLVSIVSQMKKIEQGRIDSVLAEKKIEEQKKLECEKKKVDQLRALMVKQKIYKKRKKTNNMRFGVGSYSRSRSVSVGGQCPLPYPTLPTGPALYIPVSSYIYVPPHRRRFQSM